LAKEYADLVNGLADQGVFQRNRGGGGGSNAAVPSSTSAPSSSSNGEQPADRVMANPVLSNDILQEAVPGNIRKAEHFVAFLKKAVLYLKTYLRDAKQVENKTPLAYLYELHAKSGLERKALRFTYSRLNSLLRTLEVTTLDQFNALSHVANFVTLLATYMEGFAVITEPQGSIISGVNEPLLQLCCLDASLAIKPVLDRFQSVIITSGTLSPIELYPKLLNFQPSIRDSLPMSIFRQCLRPLIVTRGSDQMLISTKFEQRDDLSVVRNYGKLLLDIVSTVPDGVCCFFTSYMYMESVINHWDQMGVLQKCMEHKLVYLETKDVVETTLALDNYKKACDSGRGAVFLSIARGKVAEGIDFDNHYGRCVVLFGIPYQYTKSHVLRARLDFMREKYQIRDNDFLTFDALRQAAQCVGRVIRSKRDYGAVVLADSRYNRQDKRSKFPPWITQFLGDSALNLSVDVAVAQIKTFLKEMGQPVDSDAFRAIVFDEAEVLKHSGSSNNYRHQQQAPAVAITSNQTSNIDLTIDRNEDDSSNNSKQRVVEELFGNDDDDPKVQISVDSRQKNENTGDKQSLKRSRVEE
jgi:DNA excision repair protein ERCC-2